MVGSLGGCWVWSNCVSDPKVFWCKRLYFDSLLWGDPFSKFRGYQNQYQNFLSQHGTQWLHMACDIWPLHGVALVPDRIPVSTNNLSWTIAMLKLLVEIWFNKGSPRFQKPPESQCEFKEIYAHWSEQLDACPHFPQTLGYRLKPCWPIHLPHLLRITERLWAVPFFRNWTLGWLLIEKGNQLLYWHIGRTCRSEPT